MRRTKTFQITLPKKIKNQLLHWAIQHNEVCWLDSNEYPQKHSSFDAVLAVDALTYVKSSYQQAFKKLEKYQTQTNDYIFGYLSYDLKNDIESLKSQNADFLHFEDLFFFQPKKIIFLKKNTLIFSYHLSVKNEIENDIIFIKNFKTRALNSASSLTIKPRVSKQEYFAKFQTISHHIQRGDIYEMNFCQEFYSENAKIHPLATYQKLNAISSPPFAAFFKQEEGYLLSASPERYLRKKEDSLISQPIKGTSKRSKNTYEDLNLQKALAKNIKERSENIMIVDLVRNDLSHIAKKGSVKVEELCKPYSFKQVHQLISTISCELPKKTHPVQALKATFPMGSMTGAPKIAAMQIIEKVENTKRGLYSGSVGYFTPNGDFDFNVVIRSILYNPQKKYVSFSVGGAITAKSTAQNEYEECLVKAEAMKIALTGEVPF